jgi:hypothetical protein
VPQGQHACPPDHAHEILYHTSLMTVVQWTMWSCDNLFSFYVVGKRNGFFATSRKNCHSKFFIRGILIPTHLRRLAINSSKLSYFNFIIIWGVFLPRNS